MSSTKVLFIISEGPTELTFVREIIAPHLSLFGIDAIATLTGTGGDVRFKKVKKEILEFLNNMPHAYVSTMFDYFRLDPKWPGRESEDISGRTITSAEKATAVQNATIDVISEVFKDDRIKNRFIPYIEMHEFEAILFSDPSILAASLNVPEGNILEIISGLETPEDINDHPNTAPSKRIEKLKPDYRKAVEGTTIAKQIGLSNIRNKCPHFNDWLTKLESINS